MTNNKAGCVFLVGAGPGDPGLLTLKGQRCIEAADVIVYDYLATPELLEYARAGAELIYVGKKGGDHTLSQDGINALLVEKASQGHTVTRLKGGDPFIFGRGGEEVEVLVDANIPFEIVPGVTSAISAPAYAGIPLTHRKHTTTLTLVTGHEDPLKEKSTIDWHAISKSGTIVFFMGVKNLANIVKRLVDCGKPIQTPVAIIRWGTTTRQQTVTGTLETIVAVAKSSGIQPPSIIVIGEVVGLREQMAWFEKKALFGKSIIITRARAQASDLSGALSGLGARCIETPVITIEPVTDTTKIVAAITALKVYHWIVFTSVNGVKIFFDILYAQGYDVRQLHHINTASIGPSTAAELMKHGLKSDIIPDNYRAESVVKAFKDKSISGKKILLPRADGARPVLPVELKKMGASVDELVTYKAVAVKASEAPVLQALEAGTVDMVTFTSSSTVQNFAGLLPENKRETLMQNVKTACIGPITADTARRLGFTVDICSDEYTIPGLIDAIKAYYAGHQ